jgi:two-component system phosphate regulon sensor histidine kinase PhoR
LKLGSRFTTLFGELAASSGMLLVFLLDATVRRAAEDQISGRESREADHLASDWRLRSPRRPDESDRLLRDAAQNLNLRVTDIAPDGRVLHDTDLPVSQVPSMENHSNRPEVREARRSGSGSSRRFSATENERRIYFARAYPDGEVLRVSVSVAGVEQIESVYVWAARLAIFVAVVLLFVIGSAAARRFSEPIERLTEAAHAIAGGEHARELPRAGAEEVQRLSAALQRMKDSLARSAERAEAERRLTAMVFERLPDGLVIVDARLHVVESNVRFARLIGISDPAGRALYDLLRHRELYEVFEETLRTGATVGRTVRLADDIVWEVTVVALPEGSRAAAVGVLRDVTRLERTEGMRRTFVADVSHELRTPIASIAAAAETLAEAEPEAEESAHLLDLIRRQSDRMRALIDDLMDLAQIESGAVELQKTRVPVGALLAETAADFSAAAETRGIALRVQSEGDLFLEGDRRRLSQMLHNLVDNALKFSPEGSTVTLTGRRDASSDVLSVSDQGPGIPRAEQDRIFQRFYQVDRSRSKSRPGTGLGLAIVKHLAHLHGAIVEVESDLGSGSEFRIRFPPD